MAKEDPVPTVDSHAELAQSTVGKIIEAGEAPVEAALIAAQPWLATPVLKQLWEAVLNWIFGVLGQVLGTKAAYIVVDIQKYEALANAGQALIQLQKAQASGDSHALTKANQDVDAAVAPILHYMGQS